MHREVMQRGGYTLDDLALIFQADLPESLLPLYLEFLFGILTHHLPLFGSSFQKLTSTLELSSHVFLASLGQNMSREQSFKYFAEVLVRHSLFRPPHSVNVFSEEEVERFTHFWNDHFLRYY